MRRIEAMKKKVSANYKIAVHQYFNGKIQLLLPLCLVDPDVPDLALVVTKNQAGNYYQGTHVSYFRNGVQ